MFDDSLEKLFHLLAARMRNDQELRRALQAAAEQFFAASAPIEQGDGARAIEEPAEPGPEIAPPKESFPRLSIASTGPREVLPPLTFASASSQAEPAPTYHAAPFDLKLMADRFAVKREGCEWHLERRRMRQSPDVDFDEQIAPHDREVMGRARALPGGCWMWMCQPTSPTPEPELMECAARCYDNLSQAVMLTRQIFDDEKLAGRHDESAMFLLAEALSATRVILEEIDAPVDRDHKQTFEWLREQTSERNIFIDRHMKLDDPADPWAWNDLADRIALVRDTAAATQTNQQQQKKLLNKIRYECQKLTGEGAEESNGHWKKIVDAATALVQEGVPPSNTQLRDLLEPVIDLLPGDLPATSEFEQVLRSIDAYVAGREAESPADAPAHAPSPEVQQVRGVLEGRAIVVIGGEPRAQSRESLRDTFGLSDVYWPQTRVHESHYNFESLIHKPEVAVVLLAIRWSGHAFGEVKAFCEAADKPLVRLPAGYSANAVAHEIIQQAGKRLGLDE